MFAICGTFGKTMQKAFIIESFGGLPKHSYVHPSVYVFSRNLNLLHNGAFQWGRPKRGSGRAVEETDKWIIWSDYKIWFSLL